MESEALASKFDVGVFFKLNAEQDYEDIISELRVKVDRE
jgi:hypothetical protein